VDCAGHVTRARVATIPIMGVVVRERPPLIEPLSIPIRLARAPGEAVECLGISRDFPDEHLMHELRPRPPLAHPSPRRHGVPDASRDNGGVGHCPRQGGQRPPGRPSRLPPTLYAPPVAEIRGGVFQRVCADNGRSDRRSPGTGPVMLRRDLDDADLVNGCSVTAPHTRLKPGVWLSITDGKTAAGSRPATVRATRTAR
jgi:hypothetical protein